MRRADRRMPLERNLVLGLDDSLRAGERRVRVARNFRLLARRWRRAADVVEQLVGCGERCVGGRRPFGFQLPRGVDGLLLALANHGHVVAAAHDFARTPEGSATDDSSMLRSVAPAIGGRTLRAWSMPGTFMSTAHVNDPSTLGGMS